MTALPDLASESWWPITRYQSPNLLQIAMPMGGLGAGCICLSGNGAFQDYSIRNKPNTTALPDGHVTREAAFATLRVTDGKELNQARLVEGPIPVEKIYDQGLQAQGYRHGDYEGLPRFDSCAFEAGYPFGRVVLSDQLIPLAVTVTGWSPFIPLDDRNSGLPAACVEYTIRNLSSHPVDIELAFHLSHLALGEPPYNKELLPTRNKPLADRGVHFYNTLDRNHEYHGSATLSVIGHKPLIKAMWLRGQWFDWIASLWREISTGSFTENTGNTEKDIQGRNGGSVMVKKTLAPDESITVPFVITWHFPSSNLAVGGVQPPAPAPAGGSLPVAGQGGDACCDPATGCCSVPEPKWRPYYAGQFADATAVADHLNQNYASLRDRTLAFARALATSTVPLEVKDAVMSNLAILKSPTVLRQENGNVWGWEGCFVGSGCCHGTCTHVWNYAQAIPHLFPHLERTLREQELQRSMDEQGHVSFRAALPDGPTGHGWHPAADGQLGGIMKVYRDWQISGDTAWMQSLYPYAKKSLDYCINRWDPDEKGALFEPHHNTYDIEFWGPDGMCTSIYLGALCAAARMAEAAGDADSAKRYTALAEKCAGFMSQELFNGEYFQQKVMWNELRDRTFANSLESGDLPPDMHALLSREGPKYQYGDGCLADGVIGAWMAGEYGIDTPINREHVRSTLAAIFKHNFKADLFRHTCTQRPGYAMGHEPGLVLCTWPRGNQPTIPFVYSDEVWTGIEYQVASHLIREGLVKEGLTLVRAARSRYEGHVRNPFNEYECGSYYARAMASYAILTALTGFHYSAVTRTLTLSPRTKDLPFRTFFSTATAFGTLTLTPTHLRIEPVEGELTVAQVVLSGKNLSTSGTAKPGDPLDIPV